MRRRQWSAVVVVGVIGGLLLGRARAEDEAGWSEVVQGVRARIVPGNRAEYRRETGLSLQIQIQNTTEISIPYKALGLNGEFKAHANGGQPVRMLAMDRAALDG